MHFSSTINVCYVDMAMGGLVSDVDTILGFITREKVCPPGCRMQKLCRTYLGKISQFILREIERMAMDLGHQTCRMAWNFWSEVYISKTCKSNLISILFHITHLLHNRDLSF